MQEPSPCPFCGGSDLNSSSNGDGNEWLNCETCGAEGPMARTKCGEDPTALWNTRAAIAAHNLAVGKIRATVDQYQNAPYRSADWLANEIMNILGVIANDAHPISKGE
jgi:hypothetical protein